MRKPLVAPFWKTGHPGTLLAALLYTESSFLAWILLGPLSLAIAASLGLSAGEAGLLASLPILAGTVLHLPMGMLGDRFGARPLALAGLALTLVALLLLWKAPLAAGSLRATALLLGVSGASFAVAMPLVSGWYPPEHQGKALGITAIGGSGTLLAVWLAPRLAETQGWQAVAGWAALPVVLAGLAMATLARQAPVPAQPRRWVTYLYVLRHGDTAWFCFFYAVTFGGVMSLAASLVGYFHTYFGLDAAEAGNLAALCVFGAALFRPLGGWLADRIGGIRTLQWVFMATAVAMLLIALAPPTATLPSVASIVVAVSALGTGNGAIFQLLSVRFHRQMGVVTGLVATAGGLGGFLLVWAFAALAGDSGSHRGIFVIYLLLALLAQAGLWSVKKRWRTTWGAPDITTARV